VTELNPIWLSFVPEQAGVPCCGQGLRLYVVMICFGVLVQFLYFRVLTSLSHMLDTVYDKVLENFESDEVQLLDVWLLYECFGGWARY